MNEEIDVGEVSDGKFKEWESRFVFKDGKWFCPKCNSIVQQTTCYISVHFKEFSGAGGGEVRHVPYPYCPKCEGKPKIVKGFVKG